MVVFYHSDDDGKCAGYWASKLNRRKTGVKDDVVEYIMINYSWPIPWEKISPGELVYIVDFSFPVEDMDKLLKITKNVVWIDHHVSAIEKYKNYNKYIDGIRVDGAAGCLLTYFYLTCCVDSSGQECSLETGQFVNAFTPETAQSQILEYLKLHDLQPPASTMLIADWDMWLFEFDEMTKDFHIGFSMIPHQPQDTIWESLNTASSALFSDCQSICEEGRIARKYRNHWMQSYCSAVGFKARFKDPSLQRYSCYAMNIAHISSEDFVIDSSPYDVLIGFSYDGNVWTYSLRAARPEVNVSAIASYFGGGGHKGAAGFVSKELHIEKA